MEVAKLLDFLTTGQQQFNVLESALNVSNVRHKVISNNIANIDTPNFRRSEVIFESYLKNYLDKAEQKDIGDSKKLPILTTNSRHINDEKQEGQPFLGAVIKKVNNQIMRTDGNNVDIDIEMADMAKNTIYYQAVAQRLNGYFSTLKSVIESR